MRTFFIRAVIFFIMAVARVTPERVHMKIANWAGKTILKVRPQLMDGMLENMKIAFKDEKSDEELRNIALRSIKLMCASALEFMQFPRLSRERVKEIVRIEGQSHIEECFARGKGIVMISGHFGSWELMAARLSVEGYPLTVVGRDQNDSVINDFIVGYRTFMGTKNIPRGVPVFDRVVELLNNNEIIGLVSDQNAGSRSGIFVDFFGVKASSFQGPALFSRKTGARILPLFCIREGYNKHRAVVCPPLDLEPTDDEAADMVRYTQAVQASIEKMVAEHPDHWFWVHKRWKSRPKEEKEAQPANGSASDSAGPAK